jgi:hypothetical protein
MDDCQEQKSNAGLFVHPDTHFEKAQACGELKKDQQKIADPQNQNDGNAADCHL